jgi:hypothetical protein
LFHKSRNAQPLRYYLYISDTKLNMLFDQIDQGILKRISAEVKVDFKVASLTLREADNPALTRAAKLRIVERYIDLHHNVGTISEPGHEYFRGTADISLAYLGKNFINTSRPTRPIFPAPVGFISTESPESDAVIMTGSQHHMISDALSLVTSYRPLPLPPPIPITGFGAGPFSGPPATAQALTDLFDTSGKIITDVIHCKNPPEILGSIWRQLSEYLKRNSFPNRMDFLAVPFTEYKSTGNDQLHVVLGTPLYVAIAHQPVSGQP